MNHLSRFFPPVIQRWLKFILACHCGFFVLMFVAVHLTLLLNSPYTDALSPYANLKNAPIRSISDCADYHLTGKCVDFRGAPSQDIHSKPFYSHIQSDTGGITDIYVTGYAGYITKIELLFGKLELADAVQMWHRPAKIESTDDSKFLIDWGNGVEVTTRPADHFDYHVLIETLTYTPG